MRIAVVQGTRPEIIKNYSVVKALRAAGVPFEVVVAKGYGLADVEWQPQGLPTAPGDRRGASSSPWTASARRSAADAPC